MKCLFNDSFCPITVPLTITKTEKFLFVSFILRCSWIHCKSCSLQCISDSQTLSLADQHFIERHPFMAQAVIAEERAPLYYMAGIIFTRMVVDQVTTKQAYTVYFLATGKDSTRLIIHSIPGYNT